MVDDDEETPAQKRKREYEEWADEVRSARERGDQDGGRYGRYRENHSEEFVHEDARQIYDKARNERIESDEEQERLRLKWEKEGLEQSREWALSHPLIDWNAAEDWYDRQVAKYGPFDPKMDVFLKVGVIVSIVAFCVLAYETKNLLWSGLTVGGSGFAILVVVSFVSAWLEIRDQSLRSKAIQEQVQAKEAREKQEEEQKRQAAIAASAPSAQPKSLSRLAPIISEMTNPALVEERGEERVVEPIQQALPETQEVSTSIASMTTPSALASPGQLSVARPPLDASPIASALHGSIWTQVGGPGVDAKPAPTIEFIPDGSLRYKQVLFADAWGQDSIRLDTVTYDFSFRKGNLVLLPRGITFTRFKRSYLERVFTQKYQQRP